MTKLNVLREANDAGSEVWRQAPGETDAAYAMFHDYMVAGAGRNLLDIYKKHRAEGKIKTKVKEALHVDSHYREMVNANNWRERVAVYDEWVNHQARLRHVELMNSTIAVLFEGAVDAARALVKGAKTGNITGAQMASCCAVLDRCGIVARGTSYNAPVAVNSSEVTRNETTVIVKLEGMTKATLEDLAE